MSQPKTVTVICGLCGKKNQRKAKYDVVGILISESVTKTPCSACGGRMEVSKATVAKKREDPTPASPVYVEPTQDKTDDEPITSVGGLAARVANAEASENVEGNENATEQVQTETTKQESDMTEREFTAAATADNLMDNLERLLTEGETEGDSAEQEPAEQEPTATATIDTPDDEEDKDRDDIDDDNDKQAEESGDIEVLAEKPIKKPAAKRIIRAGSVRHTTHGGKSVKIPSWVVQYAAEHPELPMSGVEVFELMRDAGMDKEALASATGFSPSRIGNFRGYGIESAADAARVRAALTAAIAAK